MFQTYKTKLQNTNVLSSKGITINTYEYYQQFAKEFGHIERKLFVDLYVRGHNENQTKVRYCRLYDLTSRQYNSIKRQLDGRVKARRELQKLYIKETTEKIIHLQGVIIKKVEQKEKAHEKLLQMNGKEKNFTKKVRSYRKQKHTIHQKKRRLYRLELKLKRLQEDEKNKKIRICFGSKEWFHKQFHLEENKLTFKEWKQKWQEKRAAQFTFIGSSDEKNGNQTCMYDTDNHLRIRVDNQNETTYGTHFTVPNVVFPYGQEQLDVAKIGRVGYTKGKGNKVTYYRALTFKFIREEDNWYLCATVDVDMPDIQTIKGNGCIGIDCNANFLSVTETDRFGNPIYTFDVPLKGYNVSSEVAEQSLSVALKQVVEYALEKKKPIAYEDLDFKKKKLQLRESSKNGARLLSGFYYSRYKELLQHKCLKIGVEAIPVNPAYTSQIGHTVFMKRYGLSSHGSAACVIARRGMDLTFEKVPYACPLGYPKKMNRSMERKKQWASATKHWKKHTFQQKLYVLSKLG